MVEKLHTESDEASKWAISECGKNIEVTNQSNPVVLYQNMVRCIEKNQYNQGVLLFSLAGAYSYFDSHRLPEGVKNDFHNRLLKNAIQLLTREQKNIFAQNLNHMLTSEPSLNKICAQVKKIGMPMYTQHYMNTDQIFDIGVNSEINWQKSLQGYLHCK